MKPSSLTIYRSLALTTFVLATFATGCGQPGTATKDNPSNTPIADETGSKLHSDSASQLSNSPAAKSSLAQSTVQELSSGDTKVQAGTQTNHVEKSQGTLVDLNDPVSLAPSNKPNADEPSSVDDTPNTAAPVVVTPNDNPFTVSLFSWNVESEGNDPKVIAAQLNDIAQYDVIGLTEVLAQNFRTYRDAVGTRFRYIYSKSGHNDRMMLLYNTERFDLIRQIDLNDINIANRYRAPLVAHLRDKTSDTHFMVMINHLARGKAEIRQEQARKLVEWARSQTLPLVAIGDYNFDYVFSSKTGNEAFRFFLRDNIWKWVEPEEMIDTNWFDPEPDGKDNYPGSMLDFGFVSGPASAWEARCKIMVRKDDFPDDATTSDHRPFELILSKTPTKGNGQ